MNYIELSKEISYALRHAPWEYELEINEEGWVQVEQLLDALHKDEKWKKISEKDLITMIEKSEKKRHQILNGKIKAYYGHSIPIRIVKEEKCHQRYCIMELLENLQILLEKKGCCHKVGNMFIYHRILKRHIVLVYDMI